MLSSARELSFKRTDLFPAIKPGDDFYDYAVGGWLRSHPIPDDQSRWGVFEMLADITNATVRDIVEHPERFAGTSDARLAELVGGFYRTAMDEEKIEQVGAAPLTAFFEKIATVSDSASLARVTAEMHLQVARPLFVLVAATDAKASDQVITGLVQGGLGLPERDYYLATDERSVMIRQKYAEYLTTLFQLAGFADSAHKTAQVIALETKLAEISVAKEDLRDPVKNYNKMSFAEMCSRVPGFDWQTYFSTLGVSTVVSVDVGQLPFFEKMGAIIASATEEDLRSYLQAFVVRGLAPYLSKAFLDTHFAFFGTVMSGAKQMKPRAKRMIELTNDCLGKAVGKLYVRESFSSEAKARAEALVANLRAVMGDRITRLPWMSEATKQQALHKLASMTVKIGYPDVWLDYSSLTLGTESLADNVGRCYAFEVRRELAKIGKPVDTTEWLMDPQTVNAYFEPSKNEIVFPAAILQPPFFDELADDAMNYGSIGAVIGHEITHAFDDQGRQYDAKGNLHDWWTKEDGELFSAAAKRLVEQFNTYSPVEGIFVNGQFTLGENIADLGGLAIAFEAFQRTPQGQSTELIDGFTGAQRFFLSYAQSWKTNIREEKARLYVKVDPHSPAKFRTNGPLSNMQSFFDAFEVMPGDALYRPPSERVVIW
jgi:putative endopeptidase